MGTSLYKDMENLGYEFESLVVSIFQKMGFSTFLSQRSPAHEYDICAEAEEQRLAIEVKRSKQLFIRDELVLRAIGRLLIAAQLESKTPVLVVANLLSKRLREQLSKYETLIVMDIHHLLYVVKEDEQLKNDLISMLSFSVDKFEPLEPSIKYRNASEEHSRKEISQVLAEKINLWNPEDSTFGEYEELCCKILKYLFADDLSLWNTQQNSNDGLFRFDLICKIKDKNDKEFWRMIEKYFKSKYIVFEFKNYKDKITQKEIFTTEKYLYAKALRGVAILISANGTDGNADKAIKGVLREEGKLIISLSNQDLLFMLKQKEMNEDPADYLSAILDGLLIDLEK